MTQKKSQQRKTADQGAAQPQAVERVKKTGLPDHGSSKSSSAGQSDGRTGHDKDGNTEQARRAAGGRQP